MKKFIAILAILMVLVPGCSSPPEPLFEPDRFAAELAPEYSLDFGGIGWVDCGVIPINYEAFTAEAFVIVHEYGEGGRNNGIMAHAEAGVDWSWQLRYNSPSGYMGFQLRGADSTYWSDVGEPLLAGQLYYIAGTYGEGVFTTYLDGEWVSSVNVPTGIVSSNARFFIGHDGWANSINATIDDVRISNYTLEPTKIARNWTEKNLTRTQETLALWHFSEGSGDIALDATGAYVGTLYDAAWVDSILPDPTPLQEFEITLSLNVIVGVPNIEIYASENWTTPLRHIDFGDLGRGESSEPQTLYIANEGNEYAYISIEVSEPIEHWGNITIAPNDDWNLPNIFRLMPNRYNPYQIQVHINQDAAPGHYSPSLLIQEER